MGDKLLAGPMTTNWNQFPNKFNKLLSMTPISKKEINPVIHLLDFFWHTLQHHASESVAPNKKEFVYEEHVAGLAHKRPTGQD